MTECGLSKVLDYLKAKDYRPIEGTELYMNSGFDFAIKDIGYPEGTRYTVIPWEEAKAFHYTTKYKNNDLIDRVIESLARWGYINVEVSFN